MAVTRSEDRVRCTQEKSACGKLFTGRNSTVRCFDWFLWSASTGKHEMCKPAESTCHVTARPTLVVRFGLRSDLVGYVSRQHCRVGKRVDEDDGRKDDLPELGIGRSVFQLRLAAESCSSAAFARLSFYMLVVRIQCTPAQQIFH